MIKKSFLAFLFFYSAFLACHLLYAQDNIPPVISRDVTVIKNATPSQCTSSWNGQANPEIVVNESGYGDNSEIAQGVLSCTDCAIDSLSKDCVCKTCYSYFN